MAWRYQGSHVDLAVMEFTRSSVITMNSDYTRCAEHLMLNSQGVDEDGQ